MAKHEEVMLRFNQTRDATALLNRKGVLQLKIDPDTDRYVCYAINPKSSLWILKTERLHCRNLMMRKKIFAGCW